MKSKSDNWILNEWWSTGIPLGTPGGASGSVTHIGSATVYVQSGQLSATATLLASEQHIGEIGASSIITTVTLTAGTTTYTAGDVFADTQPVASAMRVAGGKGILQNVTVIDQDDQGTALDLVIMSDHGSLGTENSAVSIADADARKIQGIVEVAAGDYVDLINSQVAHVENVGVVVQAAAGTTSLHIGAITRGAPTLQTVDSVIVKLGWLRD